MARRPLFSPKSVGITVWLIKIVSNDFWNVANERNREVNRWFTALLTLQKNHVIWGNTLIDGRRSALARVPSLPR